MIDNSHTETNPAPDSYTLKQDALRLLLPAIPHGTNWQVNRYDTDDTMVLLFHRPRPDLGPNEGETYQFDCGKTPHRALPEAERRIRAEALWEELGGDLCICQRPDVTIWCEKCQYRIQLIEEAFARAGAAPPDATGWQSIRKGD